jgi:ABC-type glycerol-3-phosphate transport system substrate-binding protein
MATHEPAETTNGVVRKVGILALAASLTLAACGTSEVLSGTAQTAGEHQSVLRDPENPHWSGNSGTPTANDTVDQRAPRPY